MLIETFREFRSPDRKTTISELYVDGRLYCHVLEDEVRPPGVKVYGQTAIPAGRYKIALGYSNRFRRTMPRVLNVPMFQGILMHNGVNITHTLGCLLTGKWDGKTWGLTNSKQIFSQLFAMMEAAQRRHEPIDLIIRNHPDWGMDAVPTVKRQAVTSAATSPSPIAPVSPSAPVARPVKDRDARAVVTSPQQPPAPATSTGRSFLAAVFALLFNLFANLKEWASLPQVRIATIVVTLCAVVYLWRRYSLKQNQQSFA